MTILVLAFRSRASGELIPAAEGVLWSDGSVALHVPAMGGAKIIFPSVDGVEAFAQDEGLELLTSLPPEGGDGVVATPPNGEPAPNRAARRRASKKVKVAPE